MISSYKLANASSYFPALPNDTSGSENDVIRQTVSNVLGWSYDVIRDILSISVDGDSFISEDSNLVSAVIYYE